MQNLTIRDAKPSDYLEIVKINADAVEQTSVMCLNRLTELVSLSSYVRVAEQEDQVVAFLLALQSGANYKNENFEWFSSRYDRFLYVDRIVVVQTHHGLGVGTMLYEDLFKFSRNIKVKLVTCEINSIPPNRRSAKFHARLGFKEVGSQWLCGNQKKVSMQAFHLDKDD